MPLGREGGSRAAGGLDLNHPARGPAVGEAAGTGAAVDFIRVKGVIVFVPSHSTHSGDFPLKKLLAAVLAALVLTPAADAQGPIRKAIGRVQQAAYHTVTGIHERLSGGGGVCVGPTCSQPSPAAFVPVPAAAPQPMPAAGPKVVGSQAAPAAAGASKVGPAFCALVRGKLRAEYAKQGMGLVERWRKAAEATDDVIRSAVAEAEKISGKVYGDLGDGTFLQKLIDFLNSPLGKELWEILKQLLLGLLEPTASYPHPTAIVVVAKVDPVEIEVFDPGLFHVGLAC